MDIPIKIAGYYTVKRDGHYSWPLRAWAGNSGNAGWPADPARTIQLFEDDVLTKAADGTYTRQTGVGCSNIALTDEDVVFHSGAANLVLHVKG